MSTYKITPEELSELIPVGHENAVTRSFLSGLTGLPDRVLRKMIEEANTFPPIINISDGKGYFKPSPSDTDYVKRFYHQEVNRANKILKKTKRLKAYMAVSGYETERIPKGKTRVREHYRDLPKRHETEGQLSLI